MHCPSCGTKALAGQNYCRACGLSLDRFAKLLAETTAGSEEKTVTHYKRKLLRFESGLKLARYGLLLTLWSVFASLIAWFGVNTVIDGDIGVGIVILVFAVSIFAAEGLALYSAFLHAKTSSGKPAQPTVSSVSSTVSSTETTHKLQPEPQAHYATSVTEQTTARLGEKT